VSSPFAKIIVTTFEATEARIAHIIEHIADQAVRGDEMDVLSKCS
jgi:hypothetical protein